MSSVGTGQMSAVETRQMPAAETGQMSAAETGPMSSVARTVICLVSTRYVNVLEISIAQCHNVHVADRRSGPNRRK